MVPFYRRLHDAIRAHDNEKLLLYDSGMEIGDRLAAAGTPLKKRTVQDALKQLKEAGAGLDEAVLDGRGTTAYSLPEAA